MTNLSNIQSQLQVDDTNLLGTQIFWSLSEVGVSYDYLERVLSQHGLEGLMPKRCTPCGAWARAVSEFKSSDYGKQFHIDSSNIPAKGNDPAKGLLTVHTKHVDADESKVEYAQMWSYQFRKDAERHQDAFDAIKSVNAVQGNIDHILDTLRSLYTKHLSSVNYSDVLATIKRVLANGKAFIMKPGLYFIPSEYSQLVSAIEGIVNNIGNSTLYTLDLPKGGRNTKTVEMSARDAFRRELDNITNQIENGLAGVKRNQGGEIGSAYHRLMSLLNTYQEKSAFYRDMLAHEHASLSDKVTDLRGKIEKALIGEPISGDEDTQENSVEESESMVA